MPLIAEFDNRSNTSPNRLSCRYVSDEAALALDSTNTVCGCVARSESPVPASAPTKMREALCIIREPCHFRLLHQGATMTTAKFSGTMAFAMPRWSNLFNSAGPTALPRFSDGRPIHLSQDD